MKFFATSPIHRERTWEAMRDHFVRMGIPIECVRRRHGVHFQGYLDGNDAGRRLPKGLKRCTFLMWDFHRLFIRLAKSTFNSDPDCEFVVWCEDACRFQKKGVLTDMTRGMRQRKRCAAHWLGFLKVKGKPWWQAHCVGL